MRLNKHISDTGFCSRREADALIAEGRVTVNGLRARIGAEVGEDDEVKVDGQALNTAFKRFKEIADKKKQITALDLEAIASDEFREIFGHSILGLKKFLKTSDEVLILACSGTGAMEAAVANFVEERSKFAVFANGYFSDRLTEMAKRQGANVVRSRS